MIKGWKNDPKWIAYYEAKKEAEAQKRNALAMQAQMHQMYSYDLKLLQTLTTETTVTQ